MPRICGRCKTQAADYRCRYCPDCRKLCSHCAIRPKRGLQRFCAECHADYQRRYRHNHPERRERDVAQTYARVALYRGTLVSQPCEICGSPEVKVHHEDYSKLRNVRWLCQMHLRRVRRGIITLPSKSF